MSRSRTKIFSIIVSTFVFVVMSILTADTGSDANAMYIEGIASWYADFSPGIRPTTANMEKFDHDKMTCAIWDVPFGTLIEVENLDNGKTVIVRVNDRGPARRYHRSGRIVDLTKGAFQRIAELDKGLTRVRLRIIGDKHQTPV